MTDCVRTCGDTEKDLRQNAFAHDNLSISQ